MSARRVPPVGLVSALLWALVVSGPLLGGAALLRPLADPPPPMPDPPVPLGVTGLAELTVLAHLAHLPHEVPLPAMPGHRTLQARDSVLDGLTPAQRAVAAEAVDVPADAVAVASDPAGPGRWGVTVAVLRGIGVEAWQVTVAAAADGLVVETLPALVGLPDVGTPPRPGLPGLAAPDPDDPITATVERFMSALLAGDGELARYLAPGAAVRPPSPAESVELRRIAAAPLPHRRAAVLAEVRLLRADGAVHLLHYPLLLQPSDGRWEVQRLLPALPLPIPAPTTR